MLATKCKEQSISPATTYLKMAEFPKADRNSLLHHHHHPFGLASSAALLHHCHRHPPRGTPRRPHPHGFGQLSQNVDIDSRFPRPLGGGSSTWRPPCANQEIPSQEIRVHQRAFALFWEAMPGSRCHDRLGESSHAASSRVPTLKPLGPAESSGDFSALAPVSATASGPPPQPLVPAWPGKHHHHFRQAPEATVPWERGRQKRECPNDSCLPRDQGEVQIQRPQAQVAL